MSAPVRAWHTDHVRFGRLLDLLDRELAKFREEGVPDYALMRATVFYLAIYADALIMRARTSRSSA